MTKKLVLLLAACLLLGPRMAAAEDTQAVLDGVGKAMGEVKSLQYSGSGAFFSLGQSFTPGEPWPRFGLKSYTRTIDYETPALRDEVVRAEGDPVARGGGLPIPGGQRLTTAVSGTLAWGQLGEGPVNPAPVAVGDRLHQLWITPHGLIKAALKYNATVQAQAEGGKKTTMISFTVPGQFKVKALVNEKNLIEKVESLNTNPVLGDMLTETVYADYKDFGGVQFPTKITQKQGGFPTLDLTISEVKANAPANIQPPDNVRQASIKVQADKVADGVWYLTGGSHHSVLVEMSDHLVVIEGPQDDARAAAVIAEVKNLAPNKPIKYVVNTHHHFDHAGGLGAFAAEGATIITHDSNKAFLEQSLAAARTIQPDKLTQTGKKAMVEGMQDKRVLSDATHIVELYRIQDTAHADGLIMAYLPKEKLLVEVDVYTPAPPNTAPPAQPNPASVNLYDNIERLKLAIDQILPLHGRKVPLAELQKWIGKAS
jgi:glyoxylase-like metal-dependent hydrolase (beta-lactamase superfamily II)